MSMASILREGFVRVTGSEEQADCLMALCESVAHMSEEKQKPVFEAADGQGAGYATLKDMALWLLMEGNALNVIHWNAETNFQHELLNEAYDLCRDVGDQLAETYIAKTGKDIEVKPGFLKDIPSTDSDTDKVLAHFKNLQEKMAGAVEKNPKFGEGIKNIFADFDEKITTIIYKWGQFKG